MRYKSQFKKSLFAYPRALKLTRKRRRHRIRQVLKLPFYMLTEHKQITPDWIFGVNYEGGAYNVSDERVFTSTDFGIY